jgi:bacteriorhodopsin
MRSQTWRFVLRTVLTVTALLLVYAVLPVPGQRESLWFTVILTVAGFVGIAYAFLSLAQRARSPSDQQTVRLEALVAVLYAFVVFMSLVYLALSSRQGQFTGLHTRVDALYFTVSTIATVGFGDVHATGQVARVVVTIQMFCDLVFVALVARIILPSVVGARARAREHALAESPDGPAGGEDADPPTGP